MEMVMRYDFRVAEKQPAIRTINMKLWQIIIVFQ